MIRTHHTATYVCNGCGLDYVDVNLCDAPPSAAVPSPCLPTGWVERVEDDRVRQHYCSRACELKALLAQSQDLDDEAACDTLAEVLVARVAKLNPKVVEGATSARCDVTVSGVPLRVMIFRETPEMRAHDAPQESA